MHDLFGVDTADAVLELRLLEKLQVLADALQHLIKRLVLLSLQLTIQPFDLFNILSSFSLKPLHSLSQFLGEQLVTLHSNLSITTHQLL